MASSQYDRLCWLGLLLTGSEHFAGDVALRMADDLLGLALGQRAATPAIEA
jgi:hypothetical protein